MKCSFNLQGQRNANAVFRYALENEVESAEFSYDTTTEEYVIRVECTELQYERIYGFVEGILLLQ
jgi:hypothetical protein